MSGLPKGWVETTLKDACAKISDGTHHSPKEQYDEPAKGLYKYVTAKNIRMAGLDLGNLTYVTERIHREIYNRCNPEFGDVLLTKDGVNAGDVAINTLDEEFSLLSSVALLKPKRDLLEPKFLRYYIESPQGTRRLLGEMRGAAIRRIILRSINAASIPIAPLPEQRRIVARIEELFSRLDAGVAALRHAKSQLQRYRQSVLAAAVTGQLTQAWREQHPDTEPAEELLKRILEQRREKWSGKGEYKDPVGANFRMLRPLPDSWRWSLIGEAFNVYVGATPSRKEPAYWGGDIPWVSSGEVAFCRIRSAKEKITESGLANTSTTVHEPGTILVGMIGEGKTRGQTAILDIRACHNQNSAAIRVSETEISPEYVYHFFTYRYEETRKEGSGGNQPALNKSRIQTIPIPLPPLAEQRQIVAEVEARTTAIDHLEAELDRQITRSKRLRQSSLAAAFSGSL